ncbi:MAG: hypothetical protein ACLGGV_04525 [Bacteroidia bacterium]
MLKYFLIAFIFLSASVKYYGQIPLYYKFKKVEGHIFDTNENKISVKFKSRRKLLVGGFKDKKIDTFLRTLTLTKIGRKSLEHLLTTRSKIVLDISNKVGITLIDGKYRLVAGLTGVEENQSNELIQNNNKNTRKYNWVYEENTISIFCGSLNYVNDSSMMLTNKNVFLFDWKTNKEIKEFSMDSIKIEPLMFPDMVYRNLRELYYFTGIHEIYHTTSENIELQEAKLNAEYDAILLEGKAFKRRKKINQKKLSTKPTPPTT